MPYIGNTPSTSFATVVKDSFSGDGSETAFTLSKVATTNSVSVFVENVRQEPTTAYSVSGTTLTFTAAPVSSSGNNIYVLHMNPTTTTTHPAAQNLTAVNGTLTGTLAVTGAISTTGEISTTTSNTTNGTFLNSSGHNTTNGVVHVKQTGATNNPTMVLEQTGDGGNPSDTQGLHIKMAGQSQGTGKAIRVTTTNASLNSGSAYDPFTVTNGGGIDVKNTSNASTLSLNQSGQLTVPLQPLFEGTNYVNGGSTQPTTGYSANSSHFKVQNIIHNIGNHYDTYGIFTAPTSGIYLMMATFGRPSDNWVAVGCLQNTTLRKLIWYGVSSRTTSSWDTREVITYVSAAANDKLYFTWANGYTAPGGNNTNTLMICKVA